MSVRKIKVAMMTIMAVLAGAVGVTQYGISDREKGEDALENAGYSSIEWQGQNKWSGLKTGVTLSDKFQAVSPDGKVVDLTVSREGVFSDEHIIKVLSVKPKK